jgi:hypothetical protein
VAVAAGAVAVAGTGVRVAVDAAGGVFVGGTVVAVEVEGGAPKLATSRV